MEKEDRQNLLQWIKEARHCVFFGGAGVSTESGVPDFRSSQGIYTQEVGAETILTPRYMHNEPEKFWTFYRHFFFLSGIQPNSCHKTLAAMEKASLLDAVVTQNVDDLHQQAGSQRVFELHGSNAHFTCPVCGRHYSYDEVAAMPLVPHCPHCQKGILRPDIVLYEEGLDMDVVQGAIQAISNADLLIIGGTSLVVYPAASLIYYQKKAGKKVLINLGETSGDQMADLVIHEPLGAVFQEIADGLGLSL